MNLAAAAFKNKAFTHYVEVLILVLAAVSYFTLGKLEDPDFTVKRAAISTAYPGASARRSRAGGDRSFGESPAGVAATEIA